MIFSVTAEVACHERETMIDRNVSGMDEARPEGKTFGRLYSDDDLRAKYSKPLKDLQQGISIRKVAKIYDLSLDTVQRIKNAYYQSNLMLRACLKIIFLNMLL